MPEPARDLPRRLPAGILALVTLLWAEPSLAQDDAQSEGGVQHRISFPEMAQQYVEVESTFPVTGGEISLLLPTWSPGSYHVLNYDSNLEIQSMRDAAGKTLAFTKLEKDRWQVPAAEAGELTVTYRVHAADLNVAESWVSPQFILLNAASVVLYTEGSRDLAQSVSVAPPPGLGSVMTALAGQGPWQARDYDELVDNPIVIHPAQPMRFRADGADYVLVNVGDDSMWDREQQRRDVKAVVAETNDLWGETPFERPYWFFNLMVERGGGLEHDHSTVMMTSRWNMRSREEYVKWLGLVAHEYFHAWNVRRMRPLELARYDYRREQYTNSLWLAEGITSYYDDLLLSRAKVVTPAEYLERLAKNLHALELTPGRERLSLEQASRDAWTRHYQPDANAINSNVSYYTKGAVVGFVLDAKIRESTEGRKSLDDVMQVMWERWSDESYPDNAFSAAVESVADGEVRAWLQPLLENPVTPDLDEALAWYGLLLERHPDKTAAEQAGDAVPAGFGINWSEDHVELVVGAVVHGFSAARAGIIPGDELLAINDERVTRDKLDDRKARLQPGEEVEFLVVRHGRLLRLPVTLGEARPTNYEILADNNNIREKHLRRLQRWLGQAVTVQ